MLGAIIGDIVGSRFEFEPIKEKDFELFTDKCRFTDDTVMTVANAAWILEGSLKKEVLIEKMHEYGNKYIECGFGNRFKEWLISRSIEPYNSFGNGSAMRVSPVVFISNSIYGARFLARASSEVTHNHIEGVKGAEAVASAMFLAKEGYSKEDIKVYIEAEFGYNLERKVDDIKKGYSFDVSCQGSVPEAIVCFIESTSFEDAIRNAISLGGDCDTQGAIAGAISEMYYGVPEEIKKKALSYLDKELIEVVNEFYKKNKIK